MLIFLTLQRIFCQSVPSVSQNPQHCKHVDLCVSVYACFKSAFCWRSRQRNRSGPYHWRYESYFFWLVRDQIAFFSSIWWPSPHPFSLYASPFIEKKNFSWLCFRLNFNQQVNSSSNNRCRAWNNNRNWKKRAMCTWHGTNRIFPFTTHSCCKRRKIFHSKHDARRQSFRSTSPTKPIKQQLIL